MMKPVFPLDVRPEFFQNLRDRVGGQRLRQTAQIIREVRFAWIVTVARRGRDAVPNHLREVKSGSSAVGLGHEDSRRRVPCPRPFGSVSPPKVARVFMEKGGQYTLGHVIADELIGIGGPIAVCVSGHTLAKKRMLVRQLRDSRQSAAQQK